MEINYIYALIDPTTFQYKYIGKSKNPYLRYKHHLYPFALKKEGHTRKTRWIKKLLNLKLKPILVILSECPVSEIDTIEKYWIKLFRKIGYDLCNLTEGGDGGATFKGRHHSLKTIEKIRSAQKNKKWELDDPRREEIKNRQKGIVPMHATIRAIEKNTRLWKVTFPNNKKQIIKNLHKFCVDNGLNSSKMYAVARGEKSRLQHKGYKCIEVYE